jgi:hypothetical protein
MCCAPATAEGVMRPGGVFGGRNLVSEMIDNGSTHTTDTKDEEPAIAVVAVRDGASAAEALAARGFYSAAAVALEVVSELLHRQAALALEEQVA